MPFTAAEIAKHLQGEVLGDSAVVLNGFAPADAAKPGDLTFAENEIYFQRATQSAASAILVAGDFKAPGKVLIRVPNARIAFAKVLPLFFPDRVFPAGVHATAIIAPSAKVDPSAHVGPYCVVEDNVRLGARAVLQGGNHIGANSQIGEDTNIFPNVTLYPQTQIGRRVRIHAGSVIGSDGFGYVQDQGVHRKVPQIGCVIIGDDVEIGANVAIDRGALGATTIGKGTKIDNLVQIAHNVTIGDGSLLVAQSGIAGSTKLGNYVILGGQVGIAGHLKIGNHAIAMAKAGVMRDIPDGEKVLGIPAFPDRVFKRQVIAIQQLPQLLRRVRELEKKLGIKPHSEDSADSVE